MSNIQISKLSERVIALFKMSKLIVGVFSSVTNSSTGEEVEKRAEENKERPETFHLIRVVGSIPLCSIACSSTFRSMLAFDKCR